ncbi:MAG: TetR/AcrR family transcriptional regulator [Rhodobacteraceae bacterium]|nr:TetR/AcrR family transcriptional regulator [Paracoccaceae bacterium]
MARTRGSFAEDTKGRIFNVAAALFAGRGFAAVSMRDIAAEAGVRAGTLYRYTPDKNTLLCDLGTGHLRALIAAWEACDQTDPLAAFVRNHLSFSLARPDTAVIASRELHCLSDDQARAVFALRTDYETTLGRILLTRGLSPEEAVFTTRSILAMLSQVPIWFRARGGLSAQELAMRYVDMTRRMVPLPATA